MSESLLDRTILLAVGGSRAYGMHMPDSDVDVKGVGVGTRKNYLGYLERWEQTEGDAIGVFHDRLTASEQLSVATSKLEGVVYEVRKFITLAADCNPNILDVIFCRDEEVRLITPLGQLLRDNKELFVSAKAKHTFSGYSASQLKRIKGHRSWLLDPPKEQPTRTSFGLPERTLIPADHLAAANAAVKKLLDSWELDLTGVPDAEIVHIQNKLRETLTNICSALGYPSVEQGKWLAAARQVGLDDNLIQVMQQEREYEAAHRHWKQYQEWKKNRNSSRAELEAKYGYDTKHGAHLVRLLRMGREILETGKVNVWRGNGGPDDAGELRSIRKGAWSYDQLIEWTDREDAELEKLYNDRKYIVPRQPDRKTIDDLCVKIVEKAIS